MINKSLSLKKFTSATFYLVIFAALYFCEAAIIHNFLNFHNYRNITFISVLVPITTAFVFIIVLSILSKKIFGLFYDFKIPVAINILTSISFIDILLVGIINFIERYS